MARITLSAKNMPPHVSLDYIETENKRGKVTVIDWNESYFDEEYPCNAELRSIYLRTDDNDNKEDYSEKHILTAIGTAQTIRLGFSLLAPKPFRFPQNCGNIALFPIHRRAVRLYQIIRRQLYYLLRTCRRMAHLITNGDTTEQICPPSCN